MGSGLVGLLGWLDLDRLGVRVGDGKVTMWVSWGSSG